MPNPQAGSSINTSTIAFILETSNTIPNVLSHGRLLKSASVHAQSSPGGSTGYPLPETVLPAKNGGIQPAIEVHLSLQNPFGGDRTIKAVVYQGRRRSEGLKVIHNEAVGLPVPEEFTRYPRS